MGGFSSLRTKKKKRFWLRILHTQLTALAFITRAWLLLYGKQQDLQMV